ncbi:MAG TPA: class I SAM-dependent methyltransferase [Acidimicrobiales bacterium]
MVTEGGWKPKRSLDRESRRAKAAKIATLVEMRRPLKGTRLLEIGTGGGIITSLLAEHVGPEGAVWSVDVDDLRTESDGYEFRLVEGTTLPFDDDDFDVVVSNHTIEHVGGPDEQLDHLREVARVMRPDGIGYLASPTRWALVEPHFKVPMLSWLPVSARDRALRLTRRGSVYDISPRTRPELLALVERAGLTATDATLDALRVTAGVEKVGPVTRLAAATPDRVLHLTRGAIPTMVFLLAHRGA